MLSAPAGRASLHDKASLRIEQVRSEDQGWYECKVLMLDQQYDTFHNGSWVHLTVNGESWLEAQGGLGVRGQLCIQSLLALVSLLCPGDAPGIRCSGMLHPWRAQLCWERAGDELSEQGW